MIKRGLQGFLKQFGYRLARANDSVVPNCGLSNFFPLIKNFGFNPEHILEVGANHASSLGKQRIIFHARITHWSSLRNN